MLNRELRRPEPSDLDLPLFEADEEAPVDIDLAKHGEIVDVVGGLWNQLAAAADPGQQDEGLKAFTRAALAVPDEQAFTERFESPLVPSWTLLRFELLELLKEASSTGFVIARAVSDSLPSAYVSDAINEGICRLLACHGVDVLEEPPEPDGLYLTSDSRGDAWESLVDDGLSPEGEVWVDPGQIYLREATAIPLLKRDEERDAARDIETARKTFVDLLVRDNGSLRELLKLLLGNAPRHLALKHVFDISLDDLPSTAAASDEDGEQEDEETAGGSPSYAFASELADLCEKVLAHCSDSARAQKALAEGLCVQRLSVAAMLWLTNYCETSKGPLGRAADLCKAKRDRLITANLRLVLWCANKYRWTGESLDDLTQYGNIGLMRAVDRFDYKREARFSTYATWWIRQSITRSVANEARLVRLPAHVHDVLTKIRYAERDLIRARKAPTAAMIAAACGVDEKKVKKLLPFLQEMQHQDFWNETELKEDEEGDVLEQSPAAVTSCDDAFESAANSRATEVVGQILATISQREAKVIRLRFGFEKDTEHTLEEVGQQFGVTRERIRQIEAKALKRLGHPVRRPYLLACTEEYAADLE